MIRPHFITLEGGEGAGKSTQMKWLAAAFAATGMEYIVTREPGGSEGGEAIRALVVSGGIDRWNAATESLLFMTARYDHLETTIKPTLARGAWVLCDRFYDSTYVYQGMAKNVGTAWLDQLYSHLFGNFAPDLTLLLDLSPSVGLLRADKRGNVAESRFEQMGHDYHERIRAGFLELASANPARIHVVDAAQPASDVHAAIITAINTRFDLALAPVASA